MQTRLEQSVRVPNAKRPHQPNAISRALHTVPRTIDRLSGQRDPTKNREFTGSFGGVVCITLLTIVAS